MKYFVGLVVIVVVAAGIFIGFNLGKNANNQGGSPVSMPASGAVTIDLSNTGLTKVTPDIYSQTNVTSLILSNNSIRTLPSEMGKMNNVVIFKIDHNLLDGSLIGGIRQMPKLKQLDVSYNKMTGMPAELGQLKNLETLNYSYNNITGLPNELVNLKGSLKEFDLTGNPLSASDVSKIKAALPGTTVIF